MKPTRITRLLKLLQRLQAGQGDDAAGLAKSCGVSRRTVFRDLDTLKKSGVPIRFDKADDCYSLGADYFLPPTNLTPDEALSIIAMASQLGADNRLPFFEPAKRASDKIRRTLSPADRRVVDSVARAIHLRINTVDPLAGQAEVYEKLIQSITDRRVAKIKYGSLTEWDTITTKLRPYQLLFSRHTWYVIGRSSLHAEPRTFNIGRIREIELTAEQYARPRGFSVERYLGRAWNLMPEPGPDHHVVVRFRPLVAQNVAEVQWHKTQRLEPQGDGAVDFHADVSGLNEIVWWILGYGDQAEVLRPVKLRRLVAARAKNMLRMYEG